MKLTADERRDWRRAKQDGWGITWDKWCGLWSITWDTYWRGSTTKRESAIRAAVILWRAYQEIRRMEEAG